MNRRSVKTAAPARPLNFNEQGANVLLAATLQFLHRNKIKREAILEFIRRTPRHQQEDRGLRQYRERVHAYEHMGVIMGTWFSDPRFLDPLGNPLSLTQTRGPKSLRSLIRASGTDISPTVALELMRQSPSIKFACNGTLSAIKRVFVLPKLDVPRAAFVIERYLSTLQQNAAGRKKASTLLLERSCHVSKVNLASITPILRDIENRGTAFMDSIDGDIEDHRQKKSRRNGLGEIGVLVFAWKRPTPADTK